MPQRGGPENIRAWAELGSRESAPVKEARHVSKYNPDPTLAESSFGPKSRLNDHPKPPRTMPGVPDRHQRPVLGLKTTKNFVVANAVENILGVPRKTVATEVDYLKKPDYGKVPAYLADVKKAIEMENTMIAEIAQQEEQQLRPKEDCFEPLPESERLDLIELLKEKWGTANLQYQRQAHLNKFEGGKLNRKEKLEKELQDIEDAIKRLSRPNMRVR